MHYLDLVQYIRTAHLIVMWSLAIFFLTAGNKDISAQGDVIKLTVITGGFNQPVDIASAGDNRLFIVERPGIIQITDTVGSDWDTPFLDIRSRINSSGSERGLLGLVFHPHYADNAYFFVNYTNVNGSTTISRFSRSVDDPDIADPNSEHILLTISQPFGNHNAGDLAFGPDGFLYFGTGDGGNGGDPGNRAQNRLNLLGKMLRIDVDNGDPYNIPANNPFADDDFTADEIWALGLRNPWRFSFDRLTGDMWIADVGQDDWEEINLQPANSPGGENYGWRCYEADMQFNLLDCPDMQEMTFPIYKYPHVGVNCSGSVTGGFVYRGKRNPDLSGIYIFTDYCKGTFRGLTMNGGEVEGDEIFQGEPFSYTTFGEDSSGEIYVASGSGDLYRVDQTTSAAHSVSMDKWRVAPNPARGAFLISNDRGTHITPGSVMVFGATGHVVDAHVTSNMIKLIDPTPGIYLIHIHHDRAATVLRAVVQ